MWILSALDDEGELNQPRLWTHLGSDVQVGQSQVLLSLDGTGLELNQDLLGSHPLSLCPCHPLLPDFLLPGKLWAAVNMGLVLIASCRGMATSSSPCDAESELKVNYQEILLRTLVTSHTGYLLSIVCRRQRMKWPPTTDRQVREELPHFLLGHVV